MRTAKDRRYPVTAPLEYRTSGVAMDGTNAVCETGTGRTLTMSSSGVWFEADRALRAGLYVTLSIAWPASLSKLVGLTLRVSGRIVHADRKMAALTMTRYAFHTRSLSATAQENRAMAVAAGQG
jgi:hypothetical protein